MGYPRIVFIIFLLVSQNLLAQWTFTSPGINDSEALSLTNYNGTLLCGTHSNGIFSSTDNGLTWNTTGGNTHHITCFTIKDTMIFAGAHEGIAGIYRSTDGGNNWTLFQNGVNSHNVISIAIHDTTVFAGTMSDTLFRSLDYGNNWNGCNNGLTDLTISALAVIGSNIFAGTYNHGVFVSGDNGDNWSPVNSGLPTSGVFTLCASGAYLFAGGPSMGIYRSADLGLSWTCVNNGLPDSTVRKIAVHGSTLFAGIAAGICYSTDNGNSWTLNSSGLVTTMEKVINDITFNGTDVFIGTEGGVFVNHTILSGIENQPLTNSFTVFPNPSTGTFTVPPAIPANQLFITDVLGRRISFNVQGDQIDISGEPSGLYFVNYLEGNSLFTSKVTLVNE